jgi:hypothetical protein
MFKRRQQRIMDMVGMIRPTSKAALKQQCLFLSNLDVEKAEKMYAFLIRDMEDIPAVEPASRSFMQNFGDQANGVVGWFRENRDVIGEGVDFVRGIIASRKGGTPPATPLPNINP